MAVYVVTGKLGNGKTLVAVGRIRDKLVSGCIVATNLDLDLAAMCGVNSKNVRVLRVPDKPSADDLHAIGNANPSYDESKNGLLVLDECGTWFNSRNWQDKSRKGVNDWFLHARKLGWDVLLIVQDINLVDSQAREAIAEHTVFCRRLDNLHIPVVGTIYKVLVGEPLRLPRVHVGKVVYGVKPDDALSDRWVYRGTALFKCYDTKQLFLADYPHGVYSQLPPWHTHGRHQRPRDWEFYMRMTKIVWKRFKSPLALAAGTLLGVSLTAAVAFGSVYRDMQRDQLALRERLVEVSAAPATRPTDALLSRLAGMRVVGAATMGERTYYDFASRENPGDTTNSDELRQIGAEVARVSDCHARVLVNGRSADLYCF